MTKPNIEGGVSKAQEFLEQLFGMSGGVLKRVRDQIELFRVASAVAATKASGSENDPTDPRVPSAINKIVKEKNEHNNKLQEKNRADKQRTLQSQRNEPSTPQAAKSKLPKPGPNGM